VVEAGVGCGVGLLGRALVARLDIGRLDLVFGAVAQPDLVDGDGREDLVGMELLGVGWCLHPQQSGGVYVGSEVWSVDASPPSLFRLGGVLGALVAVSVVRQAVPQRRR
jgi:hypothetical protein